MCFTNSDDFDMLFPNQNGHHAILRYGYVWFHNGNGLHFFPFDLVHSQILKGSFNVLCHLSKKSGDHKCGTYTGARVMIF